MSGANLALIARDLSSGDGALPRPAYRPNVDDLHPVPVAESEVLV